MTRRGGCRKAWPPDEERFWAKVTKTDGCWLFGDTTRNTYAICWFGKRAVRAHRLSYELAYGPVPDGLMVCHRCDVKRCVRPDHLFVGTNADNMQDASRKGRLIQPRRYGEDHPLAKLNWSLVRRIRENAEGISQAEWARRLGLTHGTVSKVVTGKTWQA